MQALKPADSHVQYLALDQLKPDPNNPRQHSERQIKQIMRSIRSFGFNVPILIDAEHRIIAGHGRVLAGQRLGMTAIPTLRLDHLSSSQARAFAIADNRLTENASWDEVLLGQIFLELSELELDFSLEDTGFTMGEIDLKIESLQGIDAQPDPEDQLPDRWEPTPVSQPGDLWLLGKHRVLCGNALEADAFEQLMQGQKAHAVFIDPPFNVAIQGHVSGLGAVKHREFAMASGEMAGPEYTQFLAQAFARLNPHSRAGAIHFVCMDWRHLEQVLAAGKPVGYELKNCCVWVKDKGGMGSFYRSQHEFILVFKNGKAPHRNNVQLGSFGRNRTNVWQYPGANTLSRQGQDGNLLAMHPTVKPIALVADALLDCSARGEIVLDSFLGSGSTVLAAERVGRICYGMDIDPLYVDLTIRRWQTHSGQSALHAMTRQPFDATPMRAEV